MRILGIDYGRSKIGVAVSESGLSEPLKVIRVESFEDAVKKVSKEIEMSKAAKVVVGLSEGAMGEETKKFLLAVRKEQPTIKFDIFDETLTSKDAQRMSREAGISRKKRRRMEDAYAASLLLQAYIDSASAEIS